MKRFLKGTAAVAAVVMISMVINVFCNRYGMELDSTMTTIVSAICAVAFYHFLTRNEEK